MLEEDLTVYKLFKSVNGSLVTPYLHTKAEYGEKMIAEGDMPELPDNYSKNTIGKGAIHSYIVSDFPSADGNCFVKAFVKAGTPFFVSFDGMDIASRELVLSNEEGEANSDAVNKVLVETRDKIINYIRNNGIIGNNNVKIGDVLLSDKTYITPGEINEENCKKAIGIVAFIREDGSPHVISLKQEILKKQKKAFNSIFKFVKSYSNAVTDFNGKTYTNNLKENYQSNLSDFPALEYCLKYETEGTKEGDWFFPSAGEMLQTVKNAFIINKTVDILNEKSEVAIAYKILINSYYWTSTMYNHTNSWSCDTGVANCSYFDSNWVGLFVRPSLSID